jgi:hypothetical protein
MPVSGNESVDSGGKPEERWKSKDPDWVVRLDCMEDSEGSSGAEECLRWREKDDFLSGSVEEFGREIWIVLGGSVIKQGLGIAGFDPFDGSLAKATVAIVEEGGPR